MEAPLLGRSAARAAAGHSAGAAIMAERNVSVLRCSAASRNGRKRQFGCKGGKLRRQGGLSSALQRTRCAWSADIDRNSECDALFPSFLSPLHLAVVRLCNFPHFSFYPPFSARHSVARAEATMSTAVVPGDRIRALSEAQPGEGTHIRGKHIYAAQAGCVRVTPVAPDAPEGTVRRASLSGCLPTSDVSRRRVLTFLH